MSLFWVLLNFISNTIYIVVDLYIYEGEGQLRVGMRS